MHLTSLSIGLHSKLSMEMPSGARTAFIQGAGAGENVQSASHSNLHLLFVSKVSSMTVALGLKGKILNNIPVILIFISSRRSNKCSDQGVIVQS